MKLPLFLNDLISAILGIFVLIKVQKLLPEFIPESFREFRNSINELLSRVCQCGTYEKLRKLIESTFLIRLNLENAKIYAVRQSNIAADHIPVYVRDDFTDAISKLKQDVLIKEEIKFRFFESKTRQTLLGGMKKLEANICLPLFSEKNLIGFFVLYKKDGRMPYSKEEITELLKIKKYLEITLMNILLKMNLQEENDLMKTIIDKKTGELRKRIEEVKQVLDQQSDFIAVTAHEFRTPLSIALFQLEDVLTSNKKPRELMEDLKVVDASLANLKELTQKLFDVQQYDLNKVKLHKEKIDVKKFLREIYKEFLCIMKKKNIKFTFEDHLKGRIYANIDPSQIRQLLHNFLTNAYKFTRKGGRITLTAEMNNGHADLKVSDSGKGIPNASKKTIFHKFRSKSPGAGIGLGLYICKKIMDLHKGKIWVDDSPLGGSMFCLKLKLRK